MDTVIKEGGTRGEGMDKGSGYAVMEAARRGDGKIIEDMGKEDTQTEKEDTMKGSGRIMKQLGCIGTTIRRDTYSRYMMKIIGRNQQKKNIRK
ncbi:hypothetical protein FGO68_gene5206 [Halteria grandinella]|uniref:Uncharacterized protein n=1 Tax=Halteria grandinella TaxID=5974 RepID=A0A8J8NW14_HALGN|nr:hypothetical protein FGO68_gene5206 [Halteria grandinella]